MAGSVEDVDVEVVEVASVAGSVELVVVELAGAGADAGVLDVAGCAAVGVLDVAGAGVVEVAAVGAEVGAAAVHVVSLYVHSR